MKLLISIIALGFAAALPYRFIHCDQQKLSKDLYLLKDKKTKEFHLIFFPEEHYNKPYLHVDSVMIMPGDYNIFIKCYRAQGPEIKWYRVAGRDHETIDYRGPWTTTIFHKRVFNTYYPGSEQGYKWSSKELWKHLKKHPYVEGYELIEPSK